MKNLPCFRCAAVPRDMSKYCDESGAQVSEVIWKLVEAKYIKELILGKSLSHDSKFKAILKLLKPENKSKVSCIDLHQVHAKHVLCKWHSQSPDGHKMHRNAKVLKVSVTQGTVVPVPVVPVVTSQKDLRVGQDWEHLQK